MQNNKIFPSSCNQAEMYNEQILLYLKNNYLEIALTEFSYFEL